MSADLTHEPIEASIRHQRATGDEWEIVVGLEVHCRAGHRAPSCSAAAPTSSATSPTPTSARSASACPARCRCSTSQAVELAMRLGLALHCSVRAVGVRPEELLLPGHAEGLPDLASTTSPINVDGWLELPDGTRVGIERAHLEEDTGKSTHVGGGGRIHGADYSLVDYNRAGVPLLEIVGRPDIRTAEQAKAYVDELRAILVATGASDAKMEEGSMRVDANVSVRRVGDPELGTRCEIKNLNSLRSLGRAIEYEARRQVDLLEAGRAGAAGDPPLGRGRRPHPHRAAPRRRRTTTATSPSPTWCRSTRSAEWVDRHRRRACRRCRPPAATALAEAAGVEPTETAVVVAVERDLDDLALAAIAAGGDGARVLLHVEHNLAVDGAESLDPAHFAQLVTLEVGGAAHRHPGQDRAGRHARVGRGPRRHRRRAGLRGHGHLRAGGHRRRHHRREPRRVGRLLRRRRQAPGQAPGLLRRARS